MKFMRAYIDIEKISVNIQIYDDIGPDKLFGDPIKEVPYELEEIGYPDLAGRVATRIQNMCPKLEGLDGKQLKKELASL